MWDLAARSPDGHCDWISLIWIHQEILKPTVDCLHRVVCVVSFMCCSFQPGYAVNACGAQRHLNNRVICPPCQQASGIRHHMNVIVTRAEVLCLEVQMRHSCLCTHTLHAAWILAVCLSQFSCHDEIYPGLRHTCLLMGVCLWSVTDQCYS